MGSPFVRRANSATNPLHSLVYFAPETERRLSGLGLEGGRMCYFAGRDWPTEPLLAMWHGITLLREQRGDGHIAALLAAGLAARRLLDGDGELTDAGRELRAHVEDETDRMAAPPWRHLGDEGTEEVIRIGPALTRAALAAGAFPSTGVLAPAR